MASSTWQYGFTEMEILPTTPKVFSSVTILLHGAALEMNALKIRMLRVNMYGFTAIFLVLNMTGFAFSWVQRNRFDWFYHIHHLFILVLILTCLHYSRSIVYLIPGIAIYSIDKLLGLIAYRKAGNINAKMVSRDVLEVSVKLGAGVKYQAGQYVLLNVPYVSFL